VRVVEASGSPFEVGRKRGAAVPELVRTAFEVMCCPRPVGTSLERLRDRLAKDMPHIVEEAEGLAVGADLAPLDALALSVCSDLSGQLPGFCSLVGLSASGEVVLGKNLDAPLTIQPLQVIEHVAPSDGIPYVHVTTAGAMWTDGGLNAYGLALVNASVRAKAVNHRGLPDGIVVREVLRQCESPEAAVDFLKRQAVLTFGENLLLADPAGRVAKLQVMPFGVAAEFGASIYCCNRVADNALAAQMAGDDPISANSRHREQILARLMPGPSLTNPTKKAPELLDAVIQENDARLATIAQLVVDVSRRRFGFRIPRDSNSDAPASYAWHGVARAGLGERE
jgi:isopenicillin-N N-acyltransferase like protein